MLVSSFALVILSSCNIELKDAEWFIDLGPLGAHSFHTNITKETDLTKEQWDKKRMGMFCTHSDNLTEILKVQMKLCNRTKACKKEIVKILDNAQDKIDESKQ